MRLDLTPFLSCLGPLPIPVIIALVIAVLIFYLHTRRDLGALIMGVIVNALNLFNIQSHYQQVVTGLVIILAVFANQHLGRRHCE